ncbi:Uncharacterised protein [Mycobacterium tuberculosis]|uniref:Uncharacterized protein n=1 Tax=Mycobacterium tuberculosis TaxID=1773 RepID=A0A916PGL4_MYCTX|nr:Uncharacterised protein [Mycobacterium tuberculosis]COX24560.1 Uncharacterised protein [Mycobacterium tuberculosis]COX43432.1 Uncharacterised protein [Mycobacterium tuberculosis]COY36518.1 Uncharacterised protein [Mycobacterium tuberculosis]COY89092.1 Uncharacterised protein [Mycobacterium tuberculosis]
MLSESGTIESSSRSWPVISGSSPGLTTGGLSKQLDGRNDRKSRTYWYAAASDSTT